MKDILVLLLVFFVYSNSFSQNVWAETHSIVNPVKINEIKIDSINSKSILRLFGKPEKIEKVWSEYDDQDLIYYNYKNSNFVFWKDHTLRSFNIENSKVGKNLVRLNGIKVGDSLSKLEKHYYKSVSNMKDNKITIHLIGSGYVVSSKIITFNIENKVIKSFKLIVLD